MGALVLTKTPIIMVEAAKKTPAKAADPPTASMVVAAVKGLKESKGSSLPAIKKYIAANYKVDIVKLSPFIRKALKSLVEKKKLVQTKGTGASGSFKLNKEEKKVVKKPKAKKPAKKAAKKPAAKKSPKKAKKPAAKKAAKKPAEKKAKAPKKPKSPKKAKTPKKAKSPKKAAKKAAPKKK